MIPDEYLLWSSRHGGWYTGAGPYVSDQGQARTFTYDEAVTLCRKMKQGSTPALIPVSTRMLAETLGVLS